MIVVKAFIKDNNAVITRDPALKNRCETVSRHILPACRSLIAKQLIDNHQFTQTTAAKRLGTTQAAISYYLSSKRGEKYVNLVKENPQVMDTINDLVDQIARNMISDQDILDTFCDICKLMQKN